MSLSQTQRTVFEKARALGAGVQGVALNDDACRALVGVAARDLGLLTHFPEIPSDLPEFFDAEPHGQLRVPSTVAAIDLFERLVVRIENADAYFAALAALHKARLKFRLILETQPLPTTDQVGPRGLLEFGTLPPEALIGLLFWRKWIFDIDNRAAQETGYLFQPIIAGAIGGTPASAASSPVRRRSGTGGRQVDCIRGHRAYELKMRVTIAASGQGRWREELEFPLDCVASGMTPVLVVLDKTDSPKLKQLVDAFKSASGEAHVGDAAWTHLEEAAGPTMATFLEKYVRTPLEQLLAVAPEGDPARLSAIRFEMTTTDLAVRINEYEYRIARRPNPPDEEPSRIPDDASDRLPGL